MIAFAGSVALVAGRIGGRPAAVTAFGLGALSGIELLDKLNTGVTVLALGLIAVAAAPARRRTLALPFAAERSARLPSAGRPLGNRSRRSTTT